MNYTLQQARSRAAISSRPTAAEHRFFDSALNRGRADWDRTHNFVFSLVAELPIGRGRDYLTDVSPAMDLLVGGWQFNTNTIIQSGLPFNVTYRDAGADRDTGPNRPDLIGDPEGPQTRDQWFNADADRRVRQRVRPPGARNVRRPSNNALRGPGYWRVDASLFKTFGSAERRTLEVRLEAVNLFNHVNLGNPTRRLGNTDAGRITSTAFGNGDPQRNFQFAAEVPLLILPLERTEGTEVPDHTVTTEPTKKTEKQN